MPESTDQSDPQPSPHTASCYTHAELAAAAELQADARRRIDDIAARSNNATTPEEHTALSRERANAWGDYKATGFVLTEGAEA